MVSEIETARLPPCTLTDDLHLHNLQKRLMPKHSRNCPKCKAVESILDADKENSNISDTAKDRDKVIF